MLHKLYLPLLILTMSAICTFHISLASSNKNTELELSEFFGVSEEMLSIECPQKTFYLNGKGKEAELSICLNKGDNKKRCEITIRALKTVPETNHVSFSAKISSNINNPRNWTSIMQIHAFPDWRESWRCPPLSVEIAEGNLRIFNRWDATPISKTSDSSCAKEGNSIQSRTIIKGYPIEQDKWISLALDLKLSYQDNGNLSLSIDGNDEITVSGANIYNDKTNPYLKFGVYKPNAWDEGHVLSCVTYRNMDISIKE